MVIADYIPWPVYGAGCPSASWPRSSRFRVAAAGQGLKHLAPEAKVWVLPPQWGDGVENVFVVGRHRCRGPGRLARMVVGFRHLAGFRVRGVYSPAVYRT